MTPWFHVKHALRPKKRLSIDHIMQHSTTRWQYSYRWNNLVCSWNKERKYESLKRNIIAANHMTSTWLSISIITITATFFFYWHYNPSWVCILQPSSRAIASSLTRFLDHTQRRTTVGRTPLDEWSARRRDLYLTTHYTHNRQIYMPPVGFEPTISAGEDHSCYHQ